MNGGLIPVGEARARLLSHAGPLGTETVPLDDAQDRVLAQDLKALRTQPPEAVSAMDGYAVRAKDLENAPAELTVIGEVAAGHPFAGTVGPGQATRIFTGGVVPAGADTVTIQGKRHGSGQRPDMRPPDGTAWPEHPCRRARFQSRSNRA